MVIGDNDNFKSGRGLLLAEANAVAGDVVEVAIGSRTFSGILMPSHKAGANDILTIKLSNGYNIGLKIEPKVKLKVIEKGAQATTRTMTKPISGSDNGSMPRVGVISTGGTIASYIDYRTGAVHPAVTAQDLAYSAPELFEHAQVQARILFNELSENLRPSHWQKLAEEVVDMFHNDVGGENVKGIIIPHGTDTLGYTAAALSFILGPHLPGPVILVGAQRSSDRPSSDANQNLLAAAKLAVEADLGEVVVTMHGSSSDDVIVIHRGTKVRKLHTSRRDAFQTVNDLPLGTVNLAENTLKLKSTHRPRVLPGNSLTLNTTMNDKVILLQSSPGLAAEDLDHFSSKYDGIVLAGTGLGHVPSHLLASITRAIRAGTHFVMTSQCLFGRVNMNVYSNGRDLLKAGVIPGEDMLPETAYVKLMWALGQTRNPEQVKKIMLTNYVGEITKRTLIES